MATMFPVERFSKWEQRCLAVLSPNLRLHNSNRMMGSEQILIILRNRGALVMSKDLEGGTTGG